MLGSETYLYASGDWLLQIQHPVVPYPTYSISTNYSSQNNNVNRMGTYNGTFKEISQTISVSNVTLSAQEQVRNIAIAYINAYHNETSYYIQNLQSASWSGGRTTPEGLVGSETYSYINGGSAGRAVTIQYPVFPNPVYTVNATYSSPGTSSDIISWQGTLQNGVITQTSYKYNS